MKNVNAFVKRFVLHLISTGEQFLFGDGSHAYVTTDEVKFSPKKREKKEGVTPGRKPKSERVTFEKLATMIRGTSSKALAAMAYQNDGILNINGEIFTPDEDGLYNRPKSQPKPKNEDGDDEVKYRVKKGTEYNVGIGEVVLEVRKQYLAGTLSLPEEIETAS